MSFSNMSEIIDCSKDLSAVSKYSEASFIPKVMYLIY